MASERQDRPSGDVPEIGQPLHSRAPILERIESNKLRISVRKALRAALIVGGLAASGAVAGVGWAVFGTPSSSSSSDSDSDSSFSGPCVPGENQLDCLDRLHDGEVDGRSYPAILPGLDTDGCSVLTKADQLRSPLCCPGASPNPKDCPRPLPRMGMPVLDGQAVIINADSFVPERR